MDEFRRGMLAMKIRLQDRHLTKMLEVVDRDGDGVMSYAEFLRYFGPKIWKTKDDDMMDRRAEREIDLLTSMRNFRRCHSNWTSFSSTASWDVGTTGASRVLPEDAWAFVSVFPLQPGYAFGLFAPTSRTRLFCATLIDWPHFDTGILLLIIVQCVALALDSPMARFSSQRRIVARYVDFGLTVVFTLELGLKCIASGLYSLGPRSYLRSPFNAVDALAVSTSIVYDIMLVLHMSSTTGTTARRRGVLYLRILKSCRVLRATRVLRVIRHFSGLRKLVEAFAEALPYVLRVGAIVLVILYICALFARAALEGHLRECRGTGKGPAYEPFRIAFDMARHFRKVLSSAESLHHLTVCVVLVIILVKTLYFLLILCSSCFFSPEIH